jgi:predicted transcriptional regulator
MNKENPRYLEVVKLLHQGIPKNRLHEIMGISKDEVRYSVVYARRKGISVFTQNDAILMGDLPEKVTAWIFKQTPKGASVSDVVRAILIDAYHDEAGNE